MTEAEKRAKGEGGAGPQVWMVHSGGFYRVDKTKTFDTGHELHWFRWEAMTTWLSGIVLLALVYYHGGLMVDESVRELPAWLAVTLGVAVILVGYKVYDVMMESPIGRSEKLAATIGFALIVLLSWGLSQWISGRAVYMHIGALFGTIMAINVWERILPAQRKMVAAVKEGRVPDAALGARAKLRSKQNTYLAVPVVFLMMSVHFPTATYGSRYGWVVLCLLVLAGWAAAHRIRRA
jgi:uncharacterized membrane protein